ncbi:uncharacterized protein LOC116581749 isoform X1 [Mustela erminea]|uniref:uncharacterized protein LOC116581749 isoform X1 n=1 Tax=Mustela erminea TaxID=36723 RepID=UPI001387500F|nr:uncharacterized protein LOC116581749 isoform X1 [Mustela erminea]
MPAGRDVLNPCWSPGFGGHQEWQKPGRGLMNLMVIMPVSKVCLRPAPLTPSPKHHDFPKGRPAWNACASRPLPLTPRVHEPERRSLVTDGGGDGADDEGPRLRLVCLVIGLSLGENTQEERGS